MSQDPSNSLSSEKRRMPFFPPKPQGPAPKPIGFAPKPSGPAPKNPSPASKPPGFAPKPPGFAPRPIVSPVPNPRRGPTVPPLQCQNQNSQNGGVAYPVRPNAQGFQLSKIPSSNNCTPCSPPFPAIHPPPPPSEPAPANQPSIRSRPPPPTPIQRPRPNRPQVRALYP